MCGKLECVQHGWETKNKITDSESSLVQREGKGGNISRHLGRAERASTDCPKDGAWTIQHPEQSKQPAHLLTGYNGVEQGGSKQQVQEGQNEITVPGLW